jgi:hypothetical protein
MYPEIHHDHLFNPERRSCGNTAHLHPGPDWHLKKSGWIIRAVQVVSGGGH